MFNVMYGIGSALGAALGGVMADYLGWRWEFGIQVFPLAIAITIAILAIPRHLGKQDADEHIWDAVHRFDFKGSTLLTTSVTCFVLGMVTLTLAYPCFGSNPKNVAANGACVYRI